MTALNNCRQEQQACRAKLERDGWDEFTALGLSDWLHEELLIEKEMEDGPNADDNAVK